MIGRIGQRLGNYRLVRLLGRGGFAEVYLGEHVFLKTQAAIKLLQIRLTNEDLEGFLTEARIIASLVHPHIIRVLEFGVEGGAFDLEQGMPDGADGIPFLVMDFAPNGTLRQKHPKGSRLPLLTILGYVRQITEALEYAHKQKLIHRDIKPENILLGRDNEIQLSDFGIALVSQSSRNQNTQEALGTLAYMAPEQIQGKPRFASDQYALAVMVYEWICGDRPFHGSFTEMAAQHMFAPPPPLRSKAPEILPAVEEVVMTALRKEPQERFASVRAFANALEQASIATSLSSPRATNILPDNSNAADFLNTYGPTLAAPRPTPLARPTPPILEPLNAAALDHTPSTPVTTPGIESLANTPVPSQAAITQTTQISRRAALLGLAGFAVGGGLSWLAWSLKPGITLSTPVPTTMGTLISTFRGHSDVVVSVAWSPTGTRIASGGDDKTMQVWNATSGKNVLIYRGHSTNQYGYIFSVAWSPDGARLASAGDDNTVQICDATDGRLLYTYRGHSSGVRSIAWSPDSTRIASASYDNTVQIWNAANGNNPVIYRGHSSPTTSVSWSHDGTRIASAGYDRTVQIWNATNGNHAYTYTGHSSVVFSAAWSHDSTRIASASYDQTVQVWNAANGGNAYTYPGHSQGVFTAAWSPDDKRIASGGEDELVQVWDATNGGHVFVYFGHTDTVLTAVWSPDGKLIASGGSDKTVQVWTAM